MRMKVRRREDKPSKFKEIGYIMGVIFSLVKNFLLMATLFAMPVLLITLFYMLIVDAPLDDLFKVAASLVICLFLNVMVSVD